MNRLALFCVCAGVTLGIVLGIAYLCSALGALPPCQPLWSNVTGTVHWHGHLLQCLDGQVVGEGR